MDMQEKKLELQKRLAGRREGGVTLIEIMIVLAIIALIMGFLVGPKVIRFFKEAKVETAWMMAKEYQTAYQKWAADNEAECPDKLEDLLKYTNKKDLKDPWGNTYVMKCGADQGAPEGEEFGVTSPGPDKKDGTPDDIHSWDAKPKQ